MKSWRGLWAWFAFASVGTARCELGYPRAEAVRIPDLPGAPAAALSAEIGSGEAERWLLGANLDHARYSRRENKNVNIDLKILEEPVGKSHGSGSGSGSGSKSKSKRTAP